MAAKSQPLKGIIFRQPRSIAVQAYQPFYNAGLPRPPMRIIPRPKCFLPSK